MPKQQLSSREQAYLRLSGWPIVATGRSTAEKILDSVEHLIEERGFNAISYQDISREVGISKPSIHHHFPSKTDLGTAAIRRYRERFREHAAKLERVGPGDGNDGYWRALAAYLEPILEFAATEDKICMGGILGAEYSTLSPDMQQEVARFFTEQQAWLAGLFVRGREAGAFRFNVDPEQLAATFFSAIEGGFLINRTSGEPSHIDVVLSVLKTILRGDA